MTDENEQKILMGSKNKLKLHLTLKDKSWRNGFVRDVSADFFMFEDSVDGIEPIFFLDLLDVKPFKEGKNG